MKTGIVPGDLNLKTVEPPQGQAVNGKVMAHSDLEAGQYEGGFKIWEGSKDLVEYLHQQAISGHLEILEVGCGHALPGLYCASHHDPKRLVLQDFNEEELISCTIEYVSGDWKDDQLKDYGQFDLILSSETLYNKENYEALYGLIKRRLKPEGEVLMSQKEYYFGVGGGVDEWEEFVKKKAEFEVERLKTIEGSAGSSVRCIFKMKRVQYKKKEEQEKGGGIDFSDLFPNTST